MAVIKNNTMMITHYNRRLILSNQLSVGYIPICMQILDLFDFVVADEPEKQDTEEPEEVYCRIYDWRSDKSLTYKSMKEGR